MQLALHLSLNFAVYDLISPGQRSHDQSISVELVKQKGGPSPDSRPCLTV